VIACAAREYAYPQAFCVQPANKNLRDSRAFYQPLGESSDDRGTGNDFYQANLAILGWCAAGKAAEPQA
jgi:hypothetical protein